MRRNARTDLACFPPAVRAGAPATMARRPAQATAGAALSWPVGSAWQDYMHFKRWESGSLRGVVCALLCAFCGSVLAQASASSADNSWYGDLPAARAFMADTARTYQLRRSVPVTVRALGTMSALEAVALGRASLVGSARPADPDTVIEKNLHFTTVAWDALALLTHARNPVKNLSIEQLRDIYAGRITDWAALGGTPGAINLYAVAGPLDGVEWSLRRLLFGKGSARVAAKRWYINTQQLEGAVAIDPMAIGVSLNSLVASDRKLQRLAIDGVAPSLATLQSGTYPLPTRLYVAARRETPGLPGTLQTARQVREFIRSEPALLVEWRRRQLLPAREAQVVRRGSAEREAKIHARLGVRVIAAVPPAPAVPAPPKSMRSNPQRLADLPRERAPPPFTASVRASKTNAGSRASEATAVAGCAPAVFCR